MRKTQSASRTPTRSNVIRRWLAAASVLVWLGVAPALAQDNETCMRCHDDPDLTAFHGEEEVSAFIDLAVYEATTGRSLARARLGSGMSGFTASAVAAGSSKGSG